MNKIKSMLKEAADKQVINDVDKNYIISNIDTSKVLNNNTKKAPARRRRLIPLISSLAAVFVLVLSLSLYFGLRNGSGSNNDTPINYDDAFLSKLEQFYLETTVSESNNMVNAVNTFDVVSFDVVPATPTKRLNEEMEISIVNDVDTFINNIEVMYKIKTTDAELKKNNNIDYNYENVISVINDSYTYNIYFNEKLVEEKNVDDLNYKYKSEINGVIVIGTNTYTFSGLKRIKNSKLEYSTTIYINDNYYIDVNEKFPVNSDLSLKYDMFEFDYEYHYEETTKKVNVKQKFNSDAETKEIRFVSNESLSNEVKMSILPPADSAFKCNLDSRDNEVLTITYNDINHIYTFKNSSREYTR